MEKKIQDYLHLYVNSVDCVITESNNKHAAEYGWYDDTEYQFTCSKLKVFDEDGFFNVKLSLRPLSSMTEEEMLEYARIERPETTRVQFKEGKVWSFYDDKESFYKWRTHSLSHPTPEQTVYLLSRGFDLFGLIDAGLANDKTLQSQP